MAVRRSSKIFTEITQDNGIYQGQAPPGSQRSMPRTGSSGELHAAISFRGEEAHMQSSRHESGPADAGTLPVVAENNHPPSPTRRKSTVSSAFGDAHDSSKQSVETEDNSASAKGVKSRRKSNAGLSINTSGTVADLRPDMAKTPSMKGGAPSTPGGSMKTPSTPGSMKTPSTPGGSAKGPPVFIKDGAKRASSRLMFEKNKPAANMNAPARAAPVVDDDEERPRNEIDCDTCCIFIF
jgi:hypothetical protein